MKIIDISKCNEDVISYINELQNIYDELERLSFNYGQALEDLDKKDNIINEIEKCIDYYAIENDDFSKFYNNEEIEILKIIGGDKE